jgi:hypothetical protein
MKSAVVDYPQFFLVFTGLKTRSTNGKTGGAVQTYLISKERLTEKEVFGAKCEECPMRAKCYVNQDKHSVRGALKKLLSGERTSYKWAVLSDVLPMLSGRIVRLGTYGDPSVIPLNDLAKITGACRGWLGYTHFWRDVDTDYSRYLMASCESASHELLASSLGYRRFKARLSLEDNILSDSILCPAVSRGITCDRCGLCNGSREGDKRKSIYLDLHGSRKDKEYLGEL